MTIGNALAFIERGQHDNRLRKRLNMAQVSEEFAHVLAEEKLMFSFDEFDEAFHLRLVQCQEAREAEQLKEFRLWWTLLYQMGQGASCHTKYFKKNVRAEFKGSTGHG